MLPTIIRLYNYYQLINGLRNTAKSYSTWRNPGYRVKYNKPRRWRRRRY